MYKLIALKCKLIKYIMFKMTWRIDPEIENIVSEHESDSFGIQRKIPYLDAV